MELKLKAFYKFKYNFILNCDVSFCAKSRTFFGGVSYKVTKSRRDTCLNETLAFADCERSEQKDNRLLCVLVREDGPVAMPLPEEERSASVTPISGNSLRSLWRRPVMNERS